MIPFAQSAIVHALSTEIALGMDWYSFDWVLLRKRTGADALSCPTLMLKLRIAVLWAWSVFQNVDGQDHFPYTCFELGKTGSELGNVC